MELVVVFAIVLVIALIGQYQRNRSTLNFRMKFLYAASKLGLSFEGSKNSFLYPPQPPQNKPGNTLFAFPKKKNLFRAKHDLSSNSTPDGARMTASGRYRNHSVVITINNLAQKGGGRISLAADQPFPFRLRITREGVLSGLSKAVGFDDIKLGSKTIDDDFHIRSTSEHDTIALLNKKTRSFLFNKLFSNHEDVSIEIMVHTIKTDIYPLNPVLDNLRQLLDGLIDTSNRIMAQNNLHRALMDNVLEEPDLFYRKRNFQVLLNYPVKLAAFRDDLIKLCNDKNWDIKLRAAQALQGDGVTYLADMLKEATPRQKREIISALGSFYSRRALPYLRNALHDQETIPEAISGLGYYRDQESLPDLITMAQATDTRDLRIQLIQAIGRIGGQQAENYLLSNIGARTNKKELMACVNALGQAGTIKAVEPLRNLTSRSISPSLMETVNKAVGQIHSRLETGDRGWLTVSDSDDDKLRGSLSVDNDDQRGSLSLDEN